MGMVEPYHIRMECVQHGRSKYHRSGLVEGKLQFHRKSTQNQVLTVLIFPGHSNV